MRCVSALMEYAVDNLNIECFLIGCAVSNRRSRAVPERLGYRLRATVPAGEVIAEFVYDRVVYELQYSAGRGRNWTDVQNM